LTVIKGIDIIITNKQNIYFNIPAIYHFKTVNILAG